MIHSTKGHEIHWHKNVNSTTLFLVDVAAMPSVHMQASQMGTCVELNAAVRMGKKPGCIVLPRGKEYRVEGGAKLFFVSGRHVSFFCCFKFHL